jgi:hypothetical protein
MGSRGEGPGVIDCGAKMFPCQLPNTFGILENPLYSSRNLVAFRAQPVYIPLTARPLRCEGPTCETLSQEGRRQGE